MSNVFPDYSTDYKEACFYAWYRAGKPAFNGIIKVIPPTPDGRKPNIETVRKWMRGGDGWISWHQHADNLDAEVSQKLDKETIQERIKLVKKLASYGQKLIEKGMEALQGDNPFKDDMPSAVRAIDRGIEIQFKYSGHAASLLAVGDMSDRQLDREMFRLLGKNENDTIEVEATDVDANMDIPDADEDGDSNPEDNNS